MARGPKLMGGKREGAGRKKGARNKRTEAMVKKAEAGGAMPLDIILKQMRKADADADRLKTLKHPDAKAIRDAEDTAFLRAKEAAPYLHPRLQSVTQKIDPIDLTKLPRDVLEQLITAAEGLERARAGTTTH